MIDHHSDFDPAKKGGNAPVPPGERLALLTDLYQLTMAACYFDQDMHGEATFSLFIRKYPKDRGDFVAAGLGRRPGIPRPPCVSATMIWLISSPPACFGPPSWTT